MGLDVQREDFLARKKSVANIGKTKRGKGTKFIVVADGQCVSLGVCIAPASPAKVTLIESTLKQVAVPRSGLGRPRTKPRRLIYDKAADTDALRLRLKKRGIELICPHWSNRKDPHSRTAIPCAATDADGPPKGPWPGSETFAGWWSDTRLSPRCSWLPQGRLRDDHPSTVLKPLQVFLHKQPHASGAYDRWP